MKKRRYRGTAKTLAEFDMNIPHEKATYDMVMFLTDKRWGRQRFREEFTANFGKMGSKSSGGYTNNAPRIRIANDIMFNKTPQIYSETPNVNKRPHIGQFLGDPEFVTRAVIAHQLVHALIDTPYISINPKWKTAGNAGASHSWQWCKIYTVLRKKFVNPYVEHIIYDRKAELKEQAAADEQFKMDHKKEYAVNVKAAKMCFGIKDDKKLVCTACGDAYIPERCPYGMRHMNDDGFCMDCHIEMNHAGIGSPEENMSRCGNNIGYPEDDWEYFPRICDRFYYWNCTG